MPNLFKTAFLSLLSLILLSGCSPAAPAATPGSATPPGAAASTPAKPSDTQQPAPKAVTARVGAAGSAGDSGVYIAAEKGYFRDVGLDVQVVPFQTSSMMIAPLGAGDLEVGGGVMSTALLNANERGITIKIVGTKGSSFKGFEYAQVTIRKDLIESGAVKDVKDMKGKKIALPAAKSGNEAIAYYFLKQAGLTINDVDLEVVGFPDMVAAYANKAIDAAVHPEPFVTGVVEKGLAVRWPPGATSVFYGGEYQAGALVFSQRFSENADAARRFMLAYVRALRDYNDAFARGKGKDQIVSILTKYTSEKDPAAYDKMQMPYLNPDGAMHVPSMKMDFDYLKQMGYYTGKLELQQLLDTQFVDYASKELGPYK